MRPNGRRFRYALVRKSSTAIRAGTLIGLLSLGAGLALAAETYTVSPQASQETKDAVAAGRAPAHGLPTIESVAIPSLQMRPGQFVDGQVRTSPNVGYVEVRVRNYNAPLVMTSLGHFTLHYRVPFLPPFLVGHWPLQIIARSVDGVEVKRILQIVYRY